MILLTITGAVLLFLVIVWCGVLTQEDRRLILSTSQKITVNGDERTYRLVDFSDSTEEKPLLVGLHGFQDRGLWHGLYSGLHILSERENIIVALPEGSRQSWNADICCGSAYANGVDDVAFIMKMIEEIQADYRIDTENIYAVGFSNGGAFAQKLAADRPETFKGVASVMSGVESGYNDEKIDIQNAAAKIALFQGEDDQYTPLTPEGSTDSRFQFSSVETTKNTWINHYNATRAETNETDAYEEEVYASNDEEQILFRLYRDAGHRWPQWRLWSLPGEVPESTQALWDFLYQN